MKTVGHWIGGKSVDGESGRCSDFFLVKDGTITGVADAVQTADASFTGFPYHCTLTGTLGCQEKKLFDGWIECVYCLGPLDPDTHMCSVLPGDSTAGRFAGPLTPISRFCASGECGAIAGPMTASTTMARMKLAASAVPYGIRRRERRRVRGSTTPGTAALISTPRAGCAGRRRRRGCRWRD